MIEPLIMSIFSLNLWQGAPCDIPSTDSRCISGTWFAGRNHILTISQSTQSHKGLFNGLPVTILHRLMPVLLIWDCNASAAFNRASPLGRPIDDRPAVHLVGTTDALR